MTLRFQKSALILAISLAVAACGGGGGSSKKAPNSPSDPGNGGGDDRSLPYTGVFLDAPVANIQYRLSSDSTDTPPRVTNESGEFNYGDGDEVTFFIGGLKFPTVTASSLVTPVDMAGSDQTLLNNILRLLQTLDEDGDASNGISIPAKAKAVFENVSLSLDVDTFEEDVIPFLPQISDQLTELVDTNEARKHFETFHHLQLQGGWLLSEGPGKRNVLTFIDDSRYIIIHEHEDLEEDEHVRQKAGSVEFGSYKWNVYTKELTLNLIKESDGSGGLYHDDETVLKLTLNGPTLTLNIPDEGDAVFTRIADPSNQRIGSWYLKEPDKGNENILTFLSDSEYVVAHTNNTESYDDESAQPLSGEFGQYKLGADGSLEFLEAHVDTDGPGGLYDKDAEKQSIEKLIFLPWGELRFVENGETSSFARIGSFPVTLQDTDQNGKLGTIDYAARDLVGFTPAKLAGEGFTFPVTFKDGGSSSFGFHFEEDYDDTSGEGTVFVSENTEEVTFEGKWTVNSAGAVIINFTDDEGMEIEMTLTKLKSGQTLLSLRSDEEDSLWVH